MSALSFTMKAAILRAGLRLLGVTWRFREVVPDDCREVVCGDGPGIVAFWHGGMFPIWYRFRRRGISALISASRDGELLAGYLERSLRYREVIRGSTSKGGRRALAEMMEVLERRTLLITPDGPRGPARHAKPGALIAAARSERPLIVAGWTCRSSIKLKSWDNMEIPLPFAQIDFRYCKFDFRSGFTADIAHSAQPSVSTDYDINTAISSSINSEQRADQQRNIPSTVVWIDDEMLARFDAALDNVSAPVLHG
jgi:lysophospholipid acyltransferase (LPLAT)-like uncharacterized protein